MCVFFLSLPLSSLQFLQVSTIFLFLLSIPRLKHVCEQISEAISNGAPWKNSKSTTGVSAPPICLYPTRNANSRRGARSRRRGGDAPGPPYPHDDMYD